MSNLMGMLTTIQSYVWGPPTLLLLIGTGLYFTIKLRGLQITKFPRAVRAIFEKESGTGSGEGDVSAFATLCTTMAADIGTGSIVGVATALRIGGPGSLWNENHSVGRSAADRQTISGRKNKWIKLCGKTYDE